MRPKLIIAILGAAALVLLAAILRPKSGVGAADVKNGISNEEATANPSSRRTGIAQHSNPIPADSSHASSSSGRPGAQELAPPKENASILQSSVRPSGRSEKLRQQEEQHAEYVQARVTELMDLAMNDDTNSLHTIVSELTSSNAELRKAAIEATVQFGSADAIPSLEQAAFWAEDSAEKKEFTDAIDFLKLPKLFEATSLPRSAAAVRPASPSPKQQSR